MNASADEQGVSASYAFQLVQLVKRWKVPAAELLAPLGLVEASLEEPRAKLPRRTQQALLARARTLTGEPGIGFHMGLQTRISVYGYVGFAAMSASTLGEAIALAVQFAPVLAPGFTLRMQMEGDAASLVLEEKADLGDVRDIVLIATLVGLAQIGKALTRRDLRSTVDLVIPEPDYHARFARVIPMRFGQPVNQLVFDAWHLKLPLAMADRAALRLAREQCDRELDALGYDERLGERVRAVVSKDDGFRTVDEVATQLNLSTRTLKRRLAAQGATFSGLLDGERSEKALLLLRSTQLSVDEISERLGYSTVPNFMRAFRRWTGATPAAYRRRKG